MTVPSQTATEDDSEEWNAPAELFDAVKGQLDRQAGLIGSLYHRASVLIGASGISTALLTRDNLPIVWLLPIGLFVGAIVLAVFSLRFQKAKQLDLGRMIASAQTQTQARVERNLLNAFVGLYESTRRTVIHRSRVLAVGMSLFAGGWLVAFVILLVQSLNRLEGGAN